ncbi:MAG TPA: hypothetical protein EYH31_06750 [Anaerolineae bacterium]|nr:hypothetical protein [Anaerolineae bacterium]
MNEPVYLSPPLVLSVVLALLYAALWHLFRGKTVHQLLVWCLVALLGFGIGQGLGALAHSPLPMVGTLHIAECTGSACVALFVARRLNL